MGKKSSKAAFARETYVSLRRLQSSLSTLLKASKENPPAPPFLLYRKFELLYSKKLSTLVRQNLILSLRNSLVWVVLISMIFIILFVKFLVPEDYGTTGESYYLDITQNKTVEKSLQEMGVESTSFVSSVEVLEEIVKEDHSSIGIIFQGEIENPSIEILYNFSVNPEQINIIKANVNKLIGTVNGTWNDSYNIEFLRIQSSPVPRNLTTVPGLLVFEVLILGFLLVSVFLFQEKSDNVIRAYRITPGGTHLYIFSKVIAFLILGLIYAFGIVGFIFGLGFNLLDFVILTFLGFVLYTLLGLIIAVFFEDISGWFVIGIVILTLNMAPTFSHQFPSFAPDFMKWIPSYHVIFGYDEILFPTGKNLTPLYTLLLAQNLIAYILCYFLVDKKLMKEVI